MKPTLYTTLFAFLLILNTCAEKAIAQCLNGLNPIVEQTVVCNMLEVQNPASDHMDFSTSSVLTDAYGIDQVKIYDYVLPILSGTLNLIAKGGAGGNTHWDCTGNFGADQHGWGGRGGMVSGSIRVGLGANEIAPGSTIRFIVGEAGESSNSNGVGGGGGGGATGILVQRPFDSVWSILMIAGGGGGGLTICNTHMVNVSENDIPFYVPVFTHGSVDGTDGNVPLAYHASSYNISFYYGEGGASLGSGGSSGDCDQDNCITGHPGVEWLNLPASGVYGDPPFYSYQPATVQVTYANMWDCHWSMRGGRGFIGGGACYSGSFFSAAGGGGGYVGGPPGQINVESWYQESGMSPWYQSATGGSNYHISTLLSYSDSVDGSVANGYADFEFTPDPDSSQFKPALSLMIAQAQPICAGTSVPIRATVSYPFALSPFYRIDVLNSNQVVTWKKNGVQVGSSHNLLPMVTSSGSIYDSIFVTYNPGDTITCSYSATDDYGCGRQVEVMSSFIIPAVTNMDASSVVLISVVEGDTICPNEVYNGAGGYFWQSRATFIATTDFSMAPLSNGAGGIFYQEEGESAETTALNACESIYGVGNCLQGTHSYPCHPTNAACNVPLQPGTGHFAPFSGPPVSYASDCGYFSYYYPKYEENSLPREGSYEFVYDATDITTVNKDYSTSTEVYYCEDPFYHEPTITIGPFTISIIHSSLFGEDITAKVPFTRVWHNGAFTLAQPNLDIPISTNPEYQPSINWYLNGNLLGDNALYIDGDGVEHPYVIPYTNDTLVRLYSNDGDIIRCVVTSNHCATGDSSNAITISVLPVSTGGTITGPLHPCPYSNVTYNISGATNAVSYDWIITGNASNITGEGTTRSFIIDTAHVSIICLPRGPCGKGDTAYFEVSPSNQITTPCSTPPILIYPETYCQGQQVTLSVFGDSVNFGGDVVNYNNFECYQWSNGANTRTITVTGDGTYYVYLNGCKSDSVVISGIVVPQPSIAISIIPDAIDNIRDYWCRQDGYRRVHVSSSENLSAFESVDYKWYKNGILVGGTSSFGPDNMDIFLNNNTFFNSHDTITCKVICTASCGNVTVWSNNVVLPEIINAAIPQVSIDVASTTVCSGDSVTFTALPVDGGNNPTYYWLIDNGGNCNCNFISYNGASSTFAFVNNTGAPQTHSVEVRMTSNALCISGTPLAIYNITITVNPSPTVGATVSPSATVCAGSSVTLSGTGAVSYSWNGGIPNGIPFTINSTATYTVTGTDANGCTNTATQIVTVNLLPNVTANDVNGCTGSAITLSGSPSGGNFSLPNPYTGPGTAYTYSYTDGNGCSNTSAPASITVSNLQAPSVVAMVSPSATVCAGTPVAISGTGATTYSWSGGITDGLSFTPTSTTTYTVIGTDANGCTNTATQTVTVNPLLTVGATASPSTTVCEGTSITLNGTGAANYSWSNGVTNGVLFTATSTTTYIVSDASGCGGANTWVMVKGGTTFSAGIKSDGTLWTWGSNSYGELGNGTNTSNSSPQRVGTGTNWVSVVAGSYHCLAIKSDGTLWAWGINAHGQLGDGTAASRNSPVQIGTATDWTGISAAYTYSLARKSDGTLWSWGTSTDGALGNGENFSNVPVQVGTATNWQKIAAGYYHSLATKSDGTLWAWGSNYVGELGNGTNTDSHTPVQIGTATNWVNIESADGFSLATKSNGTLWTWGYNGLGQLGDGTSTNRNAPVQVGTGTHWVDVTGGTSHSLATKSDGTLWAWGLNYYGALGDGTNANRSTPVEVGTATDWVGVSAGAYHSIGMKAGGIAWAFGWNSSSQLGDASSTNRNTPVQTVLPVGSITITVLPSPTVGATVSPSATVNEGTSVTLSGTGANTYSWSGGVTDGVAFIPSSTVTYTVTGTISNGCTSTATQTVTVAGASLTWYQDADTDGYGNPLVSLTSSGQPAGYVNDNTDCNDASASVHPGATETCNNVDDNCNSQIDEGVKTTFYADADGDGYGNISATTQACSAPSGYVSNSTDCDDASANVHPDATEVCNNVDDNCDGSIDEGVKTTFYADTDGDGYGNISATTQACSTPSGYVSNSTDCNDASGSVHPGATETCNSIDDDCDASIDEGVKTTFYADADGDGYGNLSATTQACSAPSGYVSNSTDCNDGSGSVHPGATEVCNNVDDDCDGSIDEGVKTTFYADTDGDGYGNASSTTQACSAPIGFVLNSTDCNDAVGAIHPGATEVCNNVDDDCDASIDEGVKTTFYADADGDGYGNASSTTQACSAPIGYLMNNTDCNDASTSVHPGATEVCNNLDDNCSGSIDEGVTTSFYADADGDGYGNSSVTTQACSAPSGYVTNSTDCNDASTTAHPGATEICNSIDDNCNGQIDETTLTASASGNSPLCVGSALHLTATSTGGTSYSWTGPNGFTSSQQNPNINNATVAASGTYTVTVSNTVGCSRTATTSVTVNPATSITLQPANQTACAGSTTIFSVTAVGGNLTYQWKKSNMNISGATNSTYAIANVNSGNAGTYKVVVSGNCGSNVTSNAISLTVNPIPVLSFSTTSATCTSGSDGSVTLTVSGVSGSLSYTWSNGAHTQSISGLTQGTYTVTVTTSLGCSQTGSATVGHTCPKPTNVTVSSITSTSASVTWTGVSCAVNYKLRYKAIAVSTWNYSTQTTTSKNLTGLVSGTVYEVQVETFCGTNDSSGYTSSVSFTTASSSPCVNGTNLTTTGIAAHTATLNWNAATNPVQWGVQYKTQQGNSWIDVSPNPAGSARSVTISGLAANKTYQWRLRALCGSAWTTYSGTMSFTTPSARLSDDGNAVKPTLNLYPNPNSGQFVVELKFADDVNSEADVQILNALGQIIYLDRTAIVNGELKQEVNLDRNILSGNYFVRVILEDQVFAGQVVFQK